MFANRSASLRRPLVALCRTCRSSQRQSNGGFIILASAAGAAGLLSATAVFAETKKDSKVKQHQVIQASLPFAAEDVSAAHSLREAYERPKQSKFRVAAVIRFVRPDGSMGTIEAVNAEPHDANIRGAICAERAAVCRFQLEEASKGSEIIRVVCVTDSPEPIYPGPCCREFLTAICSPDTEILASGTKDGTSWVQLPLKELLPLPSVYRRKGQGEMKTLGELLQTKVSPPSGDAHFQAAYSAALACAKKQHAQSYVFPVLFGAAVCFQDGRVYSAAELKGIEYGCTTDAVTLLLTEMKRAQEEGTAPPICLVQADQYGVAHAPFAAARGLLVEHGFRDVLVCAHTEDGNWAEPIRVQDSIPHYMENML